MAQKKPTMKPTVNTNKSSKALYSMYEIALHLKMTVVKLLAKTTRRKLAKKFSPSAGFPFTAIIYPLRYQDGY